jgi:hypothetical protein
MDAVWQGLKSYPAYVRHSSWSARLRKLASSAKTKRQAKLLELEAEATEKERDPFAHLVWSDQDIAIQLFLWHVYRATLDLKEIYLSDLKTEVDKLREFAKYFRRVMPALRLRRMELEAVRLEEVASACEDKASSMEAVNIKADDPWIIVRQRGDVKLRTFIANLSVVSSTLFGKPIRAVLAGVANVALGREDVTPSRVREMLR